MMWHLKSAITKIPEYALLSEGVLLQNETYLGTLCLKEPLDPEFARFQNRQPALALKIGKFLKNTPSEELFAVTSFVSLVLWLSFEQSFGPRLKQVSKDDIERAASQLLFDSELRRNDPSDPFETDDVLSMGQPHAVAFIREEIETTLEVYADQIDIDHADRAYQMLLLELLALSLNVLPKNKTHSNQNTNLTKPNERVALRLSKTKKSIWFIRNYWHVLPQ